MLHWCSDFGKARVGKDLLFDKNLLDKSFTQFHLELAENLQNWPKYLLQRYFLGVLVKVGKCIFKIEFM